MDEHPFWERPEDDADAAPSASRQREPEATEGVRIIGADEAAEAIERGQVAPRRGMGTPRYGDRPEAPPEDARPALRFPLSATGDPGDVVRPRVSGAPQTPLQPWTEAPSGEVPVIVPEAKGDETADDLDAWSSFASSGPRWRDQSSDWAEPDYDDATLLHDDQTRIGALDTSDRPAPDAFFAPEEPEEPEELRPPVRVGRRTRSAPAAEVGSRRLGALRHRTASAAEVGRRRLGALRHRTPTQPTDEALPERDLLQSAIAGMAFGLVAIGVFVLGPAPAVVLVAGVVAICAVELFDSLRRGGYHPAVLLGLVASVSLVGAAYWKGEVALPLVMGLTVVFALLWYLLGVTRAAPTVNLALSIFGVAYIGLLGSFAALMLTFPNGTGVLAGVVLVVAVNDAGALFAGRRFGRRLLAPDISPGKTVEGAVGGAVAGIAVALLVFGIIGLAPWDSGSAVALGLVVAVVAPLGDLCQSMIKRDLGLKDMGNVLPGHGGLLDRFDSLLFVLPAAYYLSRLLEVF